MSPVLANFLFESLNFLLLAGALGYVLFKPVRRMLDQELKQRAQDEARQNQLRAEADAMNKKARQEQEALDQELATRRDAIIAAAHKEAEQKLEQARKDQTAEREHFLQELQATSDLQTRALADTVGRVAGASVLRLLQSIDGPDLDAALIRAACDEVRTLPEPARASARVDSARPLDAESRTVLEQVLGSGFVERVDDTLGAGVRIIMASGQVDATALSFARLAATEIAHADDASLPAGAV